MVEYKLTYFTAAAVAEPIRWILKYAKVPFEDERIAPEDWPNHKSRFPLGQIPALQENGVELTQSNAIIRYLGKKFGLTSGDELLDFRVDQAIEIVTDARHAWREAFFKSEDKATALKNLDKEILPKMLKQLNSIVSSSSASGPFIGGSKVTYGDFCLAHWLQVWTKTVSPDLLKPYPALQKQVEAVSEIPAIKKWLGERPETIV